MLQRNGPRIYRRGNGQSLMMGDESVYPLVTEEREELSKRILVAWVSQRRTKSMREMTCVSGIGFLG